MADRKKAKDQTVPGGNSKSSGKGGGKSIAGGANAPDPAGNARLAGEDPSPDNRRRGEVSRADRSQSP